MKNILLILFFWFHLSYGQVDSNNHIGELNDPQLSHSTEPLNITIYSCSDDRSKPTLIKSTHNQKDTIYELVYDTAYKGTARELSEAIQSGVIEKYYVFDTDGKLYERIRPIVFEESFFEQYWAYIGIAIIIGTTIFYKLNIKKSEINIDEEEESTKTD